MLQLPLNIRLDDSARFDNFSVGHNQQLVTNLIDLAHNQSNFIYIWGAADTGKTHLGHALCHEVTQQGLSAIHLPLSNTDFSPQILDGMSCMDLVSIDELQLVIGEPDWEIELFNLYNELKNENKSLVVFSESPPAHLPIALADLKSRFSAMEIYKLESLNEEQKITFFRQRASVRGLEVSDEVIRFILTRHSRAVSDLIKILDKLDHFSIVLKRKITIPLVKQILK